MEKHTTSFDYFDLTVAITDEGDVEVELNALGDQPDRISMDWDTFREVIEFVAVHGMGMKDPYLAEYSETVEGAAVA